MLDYVRRRGEMRLNMTDKLCTLERKWDILQDSGGYSGFSAGCER